MHRHSAKRRLTRLLTFARSPRERDVTSVPGGVRFRSWERANQNHQHCGGRYGSPRVHTALRAQGRGASSRGRIERQCSSTVSAP
jgi:hypothetical protein